MSLFRDPQGFYRSPLLQELPWLEHAFGTAVAQPAPGFLTLQQIHSSHSVDCKTWRLDMEGDALTTNQAGIRVAVKTADCVPILLADIRNRAVAAVHAGWRGTVNRIAQVAVEDLRLRYGTRPSDLRAILGPCIQECCFEVGPEVAQQFQDLFPERKDLAGRARVDLAEANRRVLRGAGLADPDISTAAPCTVCGGSEFHSWRRDKITGVRMYSLIGIVPEPSPNP